MNPLHAFELGIIAGVIFALVIRGGTGMNEGERIRAEIYEQNEIVMPCGHIQANLLGDEFGHFTCRVCILTGKQWAGRRRPMSDQTLREQLAGLRDTWSHELSGSGQSGILPQHLSQNCHRCQIEAVLAAHPAGVEPD